MSRAESVLTPLVAIMNEGPFNICAPWEGDLDDLERGQFETFAKAVDAAVAAERERCAKIALRRCIDAIQEHSGFSDDEKRIATAVLHALEPSIAVVETAQRGAD